MKYIDINYNPLKPEKAIRVKKQWRTPSKQKDRRLMGLDTETIDGKAVLIADSTTRYKIINSFSDVIEFLTQRRFRDSVNFFYNVRYDFHAIIKWLPKELFRELQKKKRIKYQDIVISYLPRKVFSIKVKDKHIYSFYDIAQFYLPLSLKQSAERYLNDSEQKLNVNPIIHSYKEITREYINYCKQDAKVCQRLTQYFQDVILKPLDIKLKKPYSSASISQKYFIRNCYIPTLNYFIEHEHELLKYAINSYHGGRFEIAERGFNKAFRYDLNSAYPKEISNLINYNKGEWKHEMGFSESAYSGFVLAKIHINEDKRFGFIPIKYGNDTIYSVGNIGLQFITYKEFQYMDKNNGYEIEPISGYYFYPHELHYPFKRIVNKMYNVRQELKQQGNPQEKGYKTLLNSLYGKFWQQIPWDDNLKSTGNLFNPLWASEITAGCRIKIQELLDKYHEDVVGIATDGINFKHGININTNKTKLGAWDFEGLGTGFNVSSGIGYYNINGEIIKKFRGFSTKIDLLETIQNNPFEKFLKVYLTRPVTLAECLQAEHENDLNIFKQRERKLNINCDNKRNWNGSFNYATDIITETIQSKPIIQD